MVQNNVFKLNLASFFTQLLYITGPNMQGQVCSINTLKQRPSKVRHNLLENHRNLKHENRGLLSLEGHQTLPRATRSFNYF